MTTVDEIKAQIDKIVECLVEQGLANDQNYGFRRDLHGGAVEISFAQAQHGLIALKDIHYSDIYEELRKSRCYNVLLPDGALLQMSYLYRADALLQHRLAFFPAPHLEDFQSNPDIYLQDEVYAEVVSKNVVPFPIRFDYDVSPGVPKALLHPCSHLTLGQYENCRIPVTAPVTPYWFTDFVLRNFYNTAFVKYADSLPKLGHHCFSESIAIAERRVIHIAVPGLVE